jgi:hypothetical protein
MPLNARVIVETRQQLAAVHLLYAGLEALVLGAYGINEYGQLGYHKAQAYVVVGKHWEPA